MMLLDHLKMLCVWYFSFRLWNLFFENDEALFKLYLLMFLKEQNVIHPPTPPKKTHIILTAKNESLKILC